jgi:hypothetical protein
MSGGRHRYRVETEDGVLEVCLTEPPNDELGEAFRALIRAVAVDARQTGRSMDIGRVRENRIMAIRRRAGLPVHPMAVGDD